MRRYISMVRELTRSIFGRNAGRLFLLDQDAAHAAPAEVDGQRQPDGAAPTIRTSVSMPLSIPGHRAGISLASSVNG